MTPSPVPKTHSPPSDPPQQKCKIVKHVHALCIPTAIQSTSERQNASESPWPIPLTSSDIGMTTLQPAFDGAWTPEEPPSPPTILWKPPYCTQLKAITNSRGHHHWLMQLEKHHRPNKDWRDQLRSWVLAQTVDSNWTCSHWAVAWSQQKGSRPHTTSSMEWPFRQPEWLQCHDEAPQLA